MGVTVNYVKDFLFFPAEQQASFEVLTTREKCVLGDAFSMLTRGHVGKIQARRLAAGELV